MHKSVDGVTCGEIKCKEDLPGVVTALKETEVYKDLEMRNAQLHAATNSNLRLEKKLSETEGTLKKVTLKADEVKRRLFEISSDIRKLSGRE